MDPQSYLLDKIKNKKMIKKSLEDMLLKNAHTVNTKIMECFEENGLNDSDYDKLFTSRNIINTNDNNNEDIAKFYKKLLIVSHPDKSTCIDKEDFSDITNAYENNDNITLLEYANKYENVLDEINITILLEKQYVNLKKDIKYLRSSMSYSIIVNNDTQYLKTLIDSYKENLRLQKENEELKLKIKKINEEIAHSDTIKNKEN